MREIEFQGKSLDTGEWVRGWYEMYPFGKWPVKPSIIPSDEAIDGTYKHIEVDPATVGQYIGWKDCREQKIFEGHIVKISVPVHGCKPMEETSEVYFDNGCFCVNWGGNYRPHNRTRIDSFIPETNFEVIGNIYDNPELLEQ